jgi:hypothetical protein
MYVKPVKEACKGERMELLAKKIIGLVSAFFLVMLMVGGCQKPVQPQSNEIPSAPLPKKTPSAPLPDVDPFEYWINGASNSVLRQGNHSWHYNGKGEFEAYEVVNDAGVLVARHWFSFDKEGKRSMYQVDVWGDGHVDVRCEITGCYSEMQSLPPGPKQGLYCEGTCELTNPPLTEKVGELARLIDPLEYLTEDADCSLDKKGRPVVCATKANIRINYCNRTQYTYSADSSEIEVETSYHCNGEATWIYNYIRNAKDQVIESKSRNIPHPESDDHRYYYYHPNGTMVRQSEVREDKMFHTFYSKSYTFSIYSGKHTFAPNSGPMTAAEENYPGGPD